MSIHRRTKIPLQSSAPLPIDAATKNMTQNDQPETKLIRLSVDAQCIIHLDNALRLHCHQEEQKGQPESEWISFAQFTKLSSKIETGSSVLADTIEIPKNLRNSHSEISPQDRRLSKAERFWHDIYCVAVPALYRVNESDARNFNSNVSHRPRKRRKLAAMMLELMLVTGREESMNRLKKLRRLIRETNTNGISKTKSESALRLLLALRRERSNQADPTKESLERRKNYANSKVNGFSTIDFLLRDANSLSATKSNAGTDDVENKNVSCVASTIEDRVRARAKERERNLELAKAIQLDPREERVAIADALYSYACQVLRRKRSLSQSRRAGGGTQLLATNKRGTVRTGKGLSLSPRFLGQTASEKNTRRKVSSKCIMTFQEVVQNGLPNRSKKETARIMVDIVQTLSSSFKSSAESSSSSSNIPIFLEWIDLKTRKTNGFPISKNAIVTIDTTDFKKVREILKRQRLSNSTT